MGVRATTPSMREERRERGERGGGVARANEPRSGSERGQQSGST